MKRGARRWLFKARTGSTDANHATIRDGLRALGHFVVDTAGVGDGVPDLCVYPRVTWARIGSTVEGLAVLPEAVWLELKVAKGRERKSQEDWRARALNAGLRVATVRSLDEALAVLS